jgi:hypothetical protein
MNKHIAFIEFISRIWEKVDKKKVQTKKSPRYE